MKTLLALTVLILAGCMASAPSLPTKKPLLAHTAPSQNVTLPYHFSMDGFEVDVSTPELTTEATAFGQRVEEGIADDERWLSLGVTLVESQGKERLFPWAMVVRLKTALGIVSPAVHALALEGTLGSEDMQKSAPFERKDLRFFFRVKRGDFPIELVFADGAAAPLGE